MLKINVIKTVLSLQDNHSDFESAFTCNLEEISFRD